MVKRWKVAVAQDTTDFILGQHATDKAFAGLPGVEMVAHFDSNCEDIEKRMAYGAKKHYTDYTQMLDQEKPDIVVICSRHPYNHFNRIKEAAERGIHIYCEKPMTVCLEEADKIIELADMHKIKICTAHYARYSITFRTMKEMIENGEIGKPLKVYGWGKCDHRGGGEDLIVLGTHILDLQTWFFGQPEYVLADVTTDGIPIEKTDRCETVEPLGPVAGNEVFAHFRFPEGVTGTFESRPRLLNTEHGGLFMGITVVGTEGNLSMRFNEKLIGLRISRYPAPPEDNTKYEEVKLIESRDIPGAEPFIHEWEFFRESNRFAAWDLIQSIIDDRLPESNQYNARVVQEMIHGIYASHLYGTRVSFPLKNRLNPLEE